MLVCKWPTLKYKFFTLQGSVPTKDGIPDLEFLGPDCFHFSQRTHALSEYIRNIFKTMNKSNKLGTVPNESYHFWAVLLHKWLL
jgi:hypothetical protein